MDNFYSIKTRWPGFIETIYISHDQKVSFSVILYDKDTRRIVLHNLFVSPRARRQGRATIAIAELKKVSGSKVLTVFITDRKLIPWYAKRGFKLIKNADLIEMEDR